MNVTSKSFNWIRTLKSWEQNELWREKQRIAREEFESLNSAASSTFLDASLNLASGLGEIAAQRAYDRIQAKIKSAVDKQA